VWRQGDPPIRKSRFSEAQIVAILKPPANAPPSPLRPKFTCHPDLTFRVILSLVEGRLAYFEFVSVISV
jgi:hypothetical protein